MSTTVISNDYRKKIRNAINSWQPKLSSRKPPLDEDGIPIAVSIEIQPSPLIVISKDDIPPLADRLFNACKLDLVDDALQSVVISGMDGRGTLLPETWGSYAVQDVSYLYNCYQNFSALKLRAQDEYLADTTNQFAKNIADFAGEMATYFKEGFYEIMAQQWHIKSTSAIELGLAAQNYSDFQELIFKTKTIPLIYAVVAMIPCERLWQELAVNYMVQEPGN